MTGIEWTDRTWNPIRGCSRVSEGCRNCYAERQAARFVKPGQAFHGFAKVVAPRDSLDRVGRRRNGWTGKVELIEHKLREPLSWRKPAKVFVNSMSDLFHEGLPDRDIDRILLVMEQAHRHTYQILTKRPEVMRGYMAERFGPAGSRAPHPPPNVWLGVSAENQAAADERIPILLRTPAAVRFVSCEPLLGPISLQPWFGVCDHNCEAEIPGRHWSWCPADRPPLNWVIVGGESGPGARGCHLGWIRSIVNDCRTADLPVFVKQLGAQPRSATQWILPRDPKGGDPSEWPEDLRVREFPR